LSRYNNSVEGQGVIVEYDLEKVMNRCNCLSKLAVSANSNTKHVSNKIDSEKTRTTRKVCEYQELLNFDLFSIVGEPVCTL